MKIIGYPTLPPPDWDSLRRRSKQLPPLATEAMEMAIEKSDGWKINQMGKYDWSDWEKLDLK